MILLKFLKQQNWWYAIPCIIFLALLHFLQINLAWTFAFATGFLICYGLKFADKKGNDYGDISRLVFYFIYITAYVLSLKFYKPFHLIFTSVSWLLFFSYFYSILSNKK